MDNTASVDGKSKVKKKKGNRTREIYISQPLNFEHRAHFNKVTNQPSTSHVDVEDQTLLLPPSPGNTNIDNGQIGDIRNELLEMERRLTKTFQTEIKIALSGVYCALCANKLEENIHVNQRANETEVNKQESYGNLPEEGKYVDNSYVNRPYTSEDTSIGIKPQNEDDTKILSNLSNPTYSISDNDLSLSIMKPLGNTLIDNNSTTRIKRPMPVPRTTTSESKSDSSLTAPKEAWSEGHDQIKSLNEETHAKQSKGQFNNLRNNGQPSHTQPVKEMRAVRKQSNFDERECLAKAIQLHVQEIVATVVFKDSELPDVLTASGVITEDESSSIRTIVYRKDQIRVLLSLIKGRDLQVLNKFLKYIEQSGGSRNLIDKISSTFEDNKKSNIRGKSCVLCKVSDQVNIKYVTDKLWSIDVIDDGIYKDVVMCTNPKSSHSDLWHQLICTINNLKGDCLSNAYDALCSTLEEKNHYIHLSEAIKARTEMDTYGKLTHSCRDIRWNQVMRASCDTTISRSPRSSHSSAHTSEELLNDDNEDTSLQRRSSDRIKRPTYIDLTKETAILESQFELSENETDIKRTFGHNNEDERLRQRSNESVSKTSSPYAPS